MKRFGSSVKFRDRASFFLARSLRRRRRSNLPISAVAGYEGLRVFPEPEAEGERPSAGFSTSMGRRDGVRSAIYSGSLQQERPTKIFDGRRHSPGRALRMGTRSAMLSGSSAMSSRPRSCSTQIRLNCLSWYSSSQTSIYPNIDSAKLQSSVAACFTHWIATHSIGAAPYSVPTVPYSIFIVSPYFPRFAFSVHSLTPLCRHRIRPTVHDQ